MKFSEDLCLKCQCEHTNTLFYPVEWKGKRGFFCKECFQSAISDPKMTIVRTEVA